MTSARLAVLLALACAARAAAKDVRLAADGSGEYTTLAKALAAAVPGDILVIKKAAGMVGLALNKTENGFIVAQAIPGSPAEAAGIKAGERVLAVDGADISSWKLEEAVGLIRGPVGTIVTVRISAADGSVPREVPITRGEIRYPVKDAAEKYRIAVAEKEHELAVKLAHSLAEGGLREAKSYLAFAYFNGNGVAKKPAEAFRWAKEAAEGGDASAQRLLGYMYSNGVGADKEPKLSYHWTRQAAEKGDVAAMINLSSDYENGIGTAKDLAAALDWARRAAPAAKTAHFADGRDRAQAAIARLEPLTASAPAAPAYPAVPQPASAVTPAVLSLGAGTPKSDVDELPAPRGADPKAVALVIGIERYREALPRADFAASDARLAAEYFKRVLGVQEENLAVLTDDRATKSDFEKYVENWLPNHVDKDSKVYVYFSGHGAPEPAKGDAYLVPYDADPTYITKTGYSIKRLYAELGRLPAKSVIVAMDSCFSGAGGRSVLAKGARPLVNVKADAPPAKVVVVSASSAAQISNSYQEKGHGLFTYFLLKGLKEKGGFKAAYDYLGPEVSRVARRQYNSDQTPQWREGK